MGEFWNHFTVNHNKENKNNVIFIRFFKIEKGNSLSHKYIISEEMEEKITNCVE